MSGAVWGEVANAALQFGSAYLNYDQQRQANVQNRRLARDQREFEREMSNTAVQRRAQDIEAAGGNRALAFTNGSEATTPVYTPARIEAPRFDAPQINTGKIMQAQMLQAQLDNTKAMTSKASAETRAQNLATDIAEAQADYTVKYNVLSSAQKYENLKAENAKIFATTAAMTNEATAKAIANYVANNSKNEVIDSIKNDAILKNLHIDKDIPAAMWARIKAELLGILETNK